MVGNNINYAGQGAVQDFGVQEMRRSREEVPGVLKIELLNLRSQMPDVPVFVCEGVDDKKVYFSWLRLAGFDLDYEFVVAKGKGQLLKFRESLVRDLSGAANRVFYLVDRDFDGLRGCSAGPDIYVTDTYSVENELVCPRTLRGILTVDMHCQGLPALRDAVCDLFSRVYGEFLSHTYSFNFRIFMARRLGIETDPLPDKVGKIVSVRLQSVDAIPVDASDVVVLRRETTAAEVASCKVDFDGLNPVVSYRGKFAMNFFVRWLELLGQDRNSRGSVLFGGAPGGRGNAMQCFDIGSVAARSVPPGSFVNFVGAVKIALQT